MNIHTVAVDEPLLDGVKEDDRAGVRDIISLLHALQSPAPICKSWTVTPTGKYYDIVGHLTSKDCEVFLEDLEILQKLDNPRIVSISVKFSPAPHIRVRVASRDVPVCVTECKVIQISKKRWWSTT